MSREEDHRISPWNSAYRRSISAASPNYEYMRERDIADTYRLMERESAIDEHREMIMRGTCAVENNAQKEFEEYIKPEIEDEEEEFLFDPKELDV